MSVCLNFTIQYGKIQKYSSYTKTLIGLMLKKILLKTSSDK